MSEPKHTAGPWEVEPLPENPKLHMIIAPKVGGVYTYVARTCFGPASRANAEYIVRACNSFPELLEALKEVVTDMEGHFCEVELIPSGSESLIGSWRDMLKAAIAKAQPEEREEFSRPGVHGVYAGNYDASKFTDVIAAIHEGDTTVEPSDNGDEF